MRNYWIAVVRPDDYRPETVEDGAMRREIGRLNDEMVAAGVRVFVGGLQPLSAARTVRTRPGGAVVVEEGPCAAAGHHVGGFWVLRLASLDEALEWGRKAALACRAQIEVRAFHE